MRAFVIRSNTCPKTILSVEHFRNDGSCLCDGKPAFEMAPHAIRLFREGQWVDLNVFLTDLRGGRKSTDAVSVNSVSKLTTWAKVYNRCMRDGWPGDWSGVTSLSRELSGTHKGSVFGAFRPHAGTPDEVYFQGHLVPVAPCP